MKIRQERRHDDSYGNQALREEIPLIVCPMVQEELRETRAKVDTMAWTLAVGQQTGEDTRKKVNQIYDAMERQGLQFPKGT